MSTPLIAILMFRNRDDSKYVYKAISVVRDNITPRELIDAAHQYIGYSDETPWNTDTPFGHFRCTYVRPCSLTIEQRENGIRFRDYPTGGVRGLIIPDDREKTWPKEMLSAEHIVLY